MKKIILFKGNKLAFTLVPILFFSLLYGFKKSNLIKLNFLKYFEISGTITSPKNIVCQNEEASIIFEGLFFALIYNLLFSISTSSIFNLQTSIGLRKP